MDISTSGKGGGPYTSTINLINSSLKDDFDFHLFTYKTELGRFVSVRRIFDIVNQLREINPDIVHFTGLQLSAFHIAIACRIANIRKTIVVIHGSSTEAMNIGLAKRTVMRFLESITLAITSTFYGVSQYSSALPVTRLFKKKSSGFIYNLPIIRAKVQNNFTRENFHYTDDDVIVVTVSRITRDKGCHVLAQSIKEFSNVNQVKFLIIGSGEYLPTMKIELSNQEEMGQVKFLGYRDDVPDILPLCDIFVLPSLHETLSIALLEASYFRLPMIASDVGGIPEIIKNGANGFLVPAADPSALSQAITVLSGDAGLRREMGEQAKESLEIIFSADSITTKIREVYENLQRKFYR